MNTAIRRALAGLLLAGACSVSAFAADKIKPAVTDVHQPLPPGAIKLAGHYGDQLELCIRARIAAQTLDDLIAPFIKRDEVWTWRSEFWGKWFTSGAFAWRYNQDPSLRAKLDKAVGDLIATQTPDGYIGSYVEIERLNNWDVWGRKYVLLGLMLYHDLTGDAAALEAAKKHADFLMRDVGPGKRNIVKLGRWNGLAASSILEPMVLLHRATGEKKYLEFANWIIKMWGEYDSIQLVDKARLGVPVFDMFQKPLPIRENYGHYGQSKAYEMMSCYEGLAELYRVTGNKQYLEALEKLIPNIRDTEICVAGSGSDMERWCDGIKHQEENLRGWMETCVTATWIKLNAQVHRLNGNPAYVDEIERAAYNALLGAHGPDGAWWCHYMPLQGIRGPAPEHCQMHQNCCVASGPRAIALLPQLVVMNSSAGPVVNLYMPGTAAASSPSGAKVLIETVTDYPATDTVQIKVSPEKPETFALSLRIPAWSEQTQLAINGQPQEARAGSYAKINREWRSGDQITLKLDLRARAVALPNKSTYTAIVRGPIALCLDKRIAPSLTGDAARPLRVKADTAGYIDAKPVKAADSRIWMTFEIPFTSGGQDVTLRMCDYSSAGQTWSADSQYRTWIPNEIDARDLYKGVPDTLPKH